jgi:hypothetical protein
MKNNDTTGLKGSPPLEHLVATLPGALKGGAGYRVICPTYNAWTGRTLVGWRGRCTGRSSAPLSGDRPVGHCGGCSSSTPRPGGMRLAARQTPTPPRRLTPTRRQRDERGPCSCRHEMAHRPDQGSAIQYPCAILAGSLPSKRSRLHTRLVAIGLASLASPVIRRAVTWLMRTLRWGHACAQVAYV